MIQLLSIPKAAEVLDCSPGHVYGLIAVGQLRAVEIKAKGTRSRTRVREEDLEAFIEAHTRSADRSWRGGGRGEVRRIDGT
jgi:excisionase family DNA binding protein